MIKSKLKIEGKRIYLRTLTAKDASNRYYSWINDREINKYLESKKTTIADLHKYIKIRFNDPNSLFFGIFLKNKDIHIGNVKLEPIDFNVKKATLGILIGDKNYWNKGFATEALKILKDFAFNKLNLDEINLGVNKENIGAVKAYEKSGFYVDEEDKNIYKMKVRRMIY